MNLSAQPSLSARRHLPAVVISATLFVVFLLLALLFDSTGDNGDSIKHFLISKGAWSDPGLFFLHWGKPFFVLLSSPFAQFGFKGIKVFNVIIASLTGWLTYYAADRLKFRYPWLVFPLIFCSPYFLELIFSGLTEYLFACMLIGGISLSLANRHLASALLISFIPFARSEGLIVLAVFAFYFLVTGKFRYVPLLLAGHLLYGFAGLAYYDTILWPFTEIPYTDRGDYYGTGSFFHFFEKLNYVTGPVIYALLGAGTVFTLVSFFRKEADRKKELRSAYILLIFLMFFALFGAHTVFWWFGIFGSMGLQRVLNMMVPLIALIALFGISETVKLRVFRSGKAKNFFISIVLVAVLVFPFLPNPAALNFKHFLKADPTQKLIAEEIAPYIREKASGQKIYASNLYIILALDLDYMNPEEYELMWSLTEDKVCRIEGLVLWDSWYSVIEERIERERLDSWSCLRKLREWSVEVEGREQTFVLYEAGK